MPLNNLMVKASALGSGNVEQSSWKIQKWGNLFNDFYGYSKKQSDVEAPNTEAR